MNQESLAFSDGSVKLPAIGQNHPQSGNYAPLDSHLWADAAYPLGAHYRGDSVTFAVYSKNASQILLEIYDRPTGENAKYDYWLTKNPNDDTWRAKIAGIAHGSYYAFRCWDPNWQFDQKWQRGHSNAGFRADVDDFGHRFNPHSAPSTVTDQKSH